MDVGAWSGSSRTLTVPNFAVRMSIGLFPFRGLGAKIPLTAFASVTTSAMKPSGTAPTNRDHIGTKRRKAKQTDVEYRTLLVRPFVRIGGRPMMA